MLTDKYLDGVPDDSRAATSSVFLAPDQIAPSDLNRARALSQIARERGQTLAQMALSWVLRDGAVTSALIGASRPAQITQNLAAAQNTTFSDEENTRIETILNPLIEA